MERNIHITAASDQHRNAIVELLKANKLPAEDLGNDLSHFLIANDSKNIVGIVGLEVYDEAGLLRSLVVKDEYRDQHIASRLVEQLEDHGRRIGLHSFYLLTETAEEYFARKGYTVESRDAAPEGLKKSSEFSHVCPASAKFMKKKLK